MLTFNKITRYGSGCSKDFRQVTLLPVNKPKSGFNIMNIYGDKNYFDPNYRYYDELTYTHEEFRDITNYEGLNRVSNFGRVCSIIESPGYTFIRILKPMKSTCGYLRVELRNGGKSFPIHRLVALMFLPNPQNHPIVNHIDNCRTNNFHSNIEWCTYSHNTKHAWDTNPRENRTGEITPDIY